MRNDPDYSSKKKGLVATMVKSLWVDEGYPQSTEAAVAQYKKAVKLVNDDPGFAHAAPVSPCGEWRTECLPVAKRCRRRSPAGSHANGPHSAGIRITG